MANDKPISKAKKNYSIANNWNKVARVAMYVFALVFVIWLTLEFVDKSTFRTLLIIFEILAFALAGTYFLKRYFKSEMNYESFKDFRKMEDEFKDANSKMDYLIARVDYSYQKFRSGTSWNYGNVKFYKYSTIVLSTAATIILGLNLEVFGESFADTFSELANDVALVLNAIVAALTTLSVFWNVEKYWIQNKVIKQQLKMLKYEVEFANSTLTGAAADAKADEFFAKYIKILRDFYLYWEGVLSEEKKNGENQGGGADPAAPKGDDPTPPEGEDPAPPDGDNPTPPDGDDPAPADVDDPGPAR